MLMALHSVAVAEPLGFAVARQGGPLYASAGAISKLAKRDEGIDLRLRSHQSTTQFLPVVDGGELAFGMANAMELRFAYDGVKLFEGRRLENLRVVGVLFPTHITMALLAADSETMNGNIDNLRNKRLPGGYSGAPVGELLINASLANAGLDEADVEKVPVTGFTDGMEYFVTGRVDAAMVILGAGFVADMERRAGKLRLLSLNDDDDSVRALEQQIPVARITPMKANPRLVGMDRPINVMTYNFLVFANRNTPEDAVYKIARILYEQQPELAKLAPMFRLSNPENIVEDIGVPYHPGAIRYYRENSIWP